MLLPLALAALLLAAPDATGLAPSLPPVAAPTGQAGQPAAGPQSGSPAPGRAPTRSATQPIPRGAVLEEVSGVLEGFDRQAHRLTVGTAGGEVTLSVDRNTMVYTSAGLGTVADLVPGSQLRAGRNAEALAYWVQVRRPVREAEPPSTPGQGTGPGGGAGAPAEGGGAGAPGMPPSGVGPGSVGPGTTPATSASGR
jgi:hypothetical protein